MRKYLMTGVAALAICAAFTSCSKSGEELYDAGKITQNEAAQIEENYNKAFIATFGQPAANQDWGFGSSSRAFTRTINSNWDGWVSAPTDDDFASEFPSEIEFAASYYQYTNQVRKNYKFDNDNKVQTINFWAGNADIYVDGEREITFSAPGDGNPGITFYILPGADVTFKGDFSYNNPNNPAMYVSEGAKVTFAGKMSANVHIYNRGEIVVNDETGPYANGVIFNEGTITSKKNLSVFNAGAQVVNVGTWNVLGGMTVEGSGHFRNLGGTMTITGTTLVNSNECSWINDATFITDDYTYHAGSHDVINNCKLIVNEDFNFTIGDSDCLFQIDGGGSVVTKNFYGSGPFRVDMGAKALFKVTNNCYLDATASGIAHNGYGFYGAGSDYAVLQAKNVTNSGNPGHGYVCYGGKLYISAESHFAQGTLGAADGASYIIFKDGCSEANIYAPGFKSGKPAITIDQTECSPGFEGGNPPSDWDIRIIAEDLNAQASDSEATDDWSVGSDWDFNDVVFDVKFTSETTANVKIVGAGGVYPLFVAGHEAHQALGQSGPDSEGRYKIQNSGTSTPFEVTGIDKTKNGKDIQVTVVRKSSSGEEIISELKAEVGKPAAKIGVDPKFEPCAERQDIRSKYPLFSDWVQNNITGAWYQVD